jgi:hypothetical protein
LNCSEVEFDNIKMQVMHVKIEMDVKEIRSETVDWIDVDMDKKKWKNVVKKVIKFRGPQNTGEFIELAEEI